MMRHQAWQLRLLTHGWVVPLCTAVFWMFVPWAVHRNSPRTLVSFHGLLHAGIASRFFGVTTGALPPENPFFAGQTVVYYWVFQYLAAQLTRIFGLNIFHSFEVLILFALGAMMVTAVWFGRKLYGSTTAGMLMGYLIVAGTNPLGWLHLINGVVRGGPGTLNDNPSYLWGVVHPIYSLIRYNDIGGVYGPLLNFFLNITSRPIALAGLLATLLCLEWLLRSRSRWAFVSVCLTFALTTVFSPIIGVIVIGALSLSMAACFLWHRRLFPTEQEETQQARRGLLYSVVALIAGIVIAFPTFFQMVIGPSSSHAQFTLFSVEGLRMIVSVSLSISVLFILALIGMFRAESDRKMFFGILVFSALVLLALDVAVTLPAGNSSNMFHAAVVMLAVPAAGSIFSGSSSGARSILSNRRLAFVVLVFLPTVALLLVSYVQRPALAVSFQSQDIAIADEGSDLARLYRWAQNDTDPSSIFVMDVRERTAVCGNTAEFPAMTHRTMFTENLSHYIVEPYADAKMRNEMALRLISGEKPSDADSTYLAKFNRPIYVAIYGVSFDSKDNALPARMQEIYGPAAFSSGSILVFRWQASSN